MHPHSLLELATELLRSVLKFDSPADGLVSMFFESVTIDGITRPRFERIGD